MTHKDTVAAGRERSPDASGTFPVEPTLESISLLSEQVTEFAESCDVPGVHIQRVSLAIDELLSNIILYGTNGETPPAILVSVRVAGHYFTIEVEHSGPAFDPFQDAAVPDTSLPLENRPIGGLGIFLVRSLMSSVHYERVGDRNRVTLVRTLETPDERG